MAEKVTIVISRRTYERLKDASLSGGHGWEVGGFAGFRSDGPVSIEVDEPTVAKLNKIAPNNHDYALTVILDEYFHRRQVN
jgi:hypothetical protein